MPVGYHEGPLARLEAGRHGEGPSSDAGRVRWQSRRRVVVRTR